MVREKQKSGVTPHKKTDTTLNIFAEYFHNDTKQQCNVWFVKNKKWRNSTQKKTDTTLNIFAEYFHKDTKQHQASRSQLSKLAFSVPFLVTRLNYVLGNIFKILYHQRGLDVLVKKSRKWNGKWMGVCVKNHSCDLTSCNKWHDLQQVARPEIDL